MSRLASLSPAALRAMYSPDADDTLVVLLTITGPGLATPLRLANGFDHRLSETDDDVIYGITSRGSDYTFLPFGITLPDDQPGSTPRARVTLHDVTRETIPVIRQATQALSVLVELVLRTTPDVVEVAFDGMLMGGIGYDANTVSAELSYESLAGEPFPAHTFTPSVAPGLF